MSCRSGLPAAFRVRQREAAERDSWAPASSFNARTSGSPTRTVYWRTTRFASQICVCLAASKSGPPGGLF
eukprot:15434160-Alexandrium_andersonii.AAC.1